MGIMHRNPIKRSNEGVRIIVTAIMGVAVGFFIGISLSSLHFTKISLLSNLENSFQEVRSLGNVNPETSGSGSLLKFSDDFAILLFHYDGRTSEWDQYEWSKNAIHVSVMKQTKWWYAKRFLHPDIVSAFEYIFIWDEDLGVEHFNADEFINITKKHGLEISQPGLEPNNGLTWEMTKRRGDSEVHMVTEEKPGWCSDPHLPPCAAFVEIMAPVFSREAWRCVWHMIQNDLVHGWGLDFALRRCVEPAHEKIGVVDSQWIVHQVIPSLGQQGEASNGEEPREAVRTRCRNEWAEFQARMNNADKSYFEGLNSFRKG
ncbi:hypothetical protein PIB30_050427 [Stylosanthes scabra]|uniref:Uncharacterized protein n=1 Tax=Stylosanthes scabra TaxID=79078 RepID=A0ABU6ZGE9_9FABA|nr:hypothetical protein [Stylosanthes scabra]